MVSGFSTSVVVGLRPYAHDMAGIDYVTGDATSPEGDEPRIIAHVCNDVGGWGAGFVLAVSKRWREPEIAYRRWYDDRDSNDFALGATQFVEVEPGLWVANMVGQRGIRRGSDGAPPVRYDAIETALAAVGDKALEEGASVHMPRIGCGLAGGHWSEVEPLIERSLTDRGIRTVVYDLGRSAERQGAETRSPGMGGKP